MVYIYTSQRDKGEDVREGQNFQTYINFKSRQTYINFEVKKDFQISWCSDVVRSIEQIEIEIKVLRI